MSAPILIVGVTGQVGGALTEVLGAERVTGTARDAPEGVRPLDLDDVAQRDGLASDVIATARPAWLVIAAGWTWVDGCEDDPDKAMRINRDAPARLAAATRAKGGRTVYYSTEYVFDGAAGPYDESAATNPLSAYGKSKLEGELAVLEADPDALILRTTVVYGPEGKGKNFAYRLAASLGKGETIQVPADQISSPTYNRDLAAATVGLMERGASGVFNATGAEVLDRAALSRRIAVALGHDPALIEPVVTADLNQRAARPLKAGLLVDKLRAALPDLRLRTVEQAVADWLERPRGKAWPGD